MDVVQEEKIYTIEDIYALPDGERAELIDGKIYFMSSPNVDHERICKKLIRTIDDYIEGNNGNCESFIAPCAVFLNNDNTTYVEPDVFVVCDPNKIDNKGCHGAPDWIIEVVSPSSRTLDYLIKANKYHDAGVKEYWIVDPRDKQVTVYNFEDEMTISSYHFGEDIPVGIYSGFSIMLPSNL